MISEAFPVVVTETKQKDAWFSANVGKTGRTRTVSAHAVKIFIGRSSFISSTRYSSRAKAEAAAKRIMAKHGKAKKEVQDD